MFQFYLCPKEITPKGFKSSLKPVDLKNYQEAQPRLYRLSNNRQRLPALPPAAPP